jgi:hypothetical protein
MARWCISTGQSPETWRTLTRLEREAFTDTVKEARRG